VLAHELAHHLLERLLVRPPRWLDEGLAEHLETAGAPAVLPGTVGSTPSWSRGGWRPEPGFVRRLLAWDGRLDPAEPRRHSSEAWALVHFLVNEEPARLAAYLGALEAGRPAAAAFDLVFPEWSPRHLLGAYLLEARVVAFLDEGRHRTTSYPDLASARTDVSVRPAATADLHLLRLELPRRERRPVEAVRAEVDAALLEDPGHPEALRWRAQLEGLAPLPLALAAVEAHPRDWRAWRFLAGALPPEGEDLDREAALRRALTLAPDRPELLRSLAQHLADRGRHAEAAPLARLAAELAPWDPAVVAVYASVALTLRACPVDRVAASRAAALRVEPTLDPERRGLARALDALEQRCELARFAEAASAPAWAMAGSP